MTQVRTPTTLSVYFPKGKLGKKPIERLERLGKKLDRSINYLIVQAVMEYLDRAKPS